MEEEKAQNKVIENRFSYHKPTCEQQEKYVEIRETAKNLAYTIEDMCPDSREKSLAMTKLQETVMWANASIALSD
jgi:hypothetical protein